MAMAASFSATAAESKQQKGLKRKADVQTMYCSVCKIILNSKAQADAHYAGKSHRNKVRNLSSEGSHTSDGNISFPVQRSSSSVNLKCQLCQKVFNSVMQMKDHLSGKLHQQMAQVKSKHSSPVVDTFAACVSAEANSSLVTSLTTTVAEATSVQSTSTLTSPSVGVPMPHGKNLSNVFHCSMCNITLNSLKQLEQHNKGLRHKIIIGKAKPPTISGEKWENVRFMKISNAILGMCKDTVSGSGGGLNLREFHCDTCNITVNSKIQLDQHLESNKHKMKVVQLLVQNKQKHPALSFGNTGSGSGQTHPRYKNFVCSGLFSPGYGDCSDTYQISYPKQYIPYNNLQNFSCNYPVYEANLAMF